METTNETISPIIKGFLVLLSVLVIFVLGVIIAVLPMDMTVCTVRGESMSPTLEDGAVLLLNGERELDRFDIAVFSDGDHYLIKRVVGLPGDEVTVMDGHLFVNDEMYHEPYVASANKKEFASVNFTTTVPDGSYYVLGDNRDGSFDSREAGVVPEDAFIGVAIWELKKD
jgi:signal peptidase I